MRLLPLLVLASLTGCGCNGKTVVKNPEPDASVADVLTRLEKRKEATVSFQAQTQMDYWLGDERVNTGVLVMGKRGARIRLNAEMPTGDSVAADLACDGVEFRFVDFNQNCVMIGPCTGESIAALLHVTMEPDDFLLIAMGSTPVIPDADGTMEWDEQHGHHVVKLQSGDGELQQKIIFDGKESRWDVLSSEVMNANGVTQWKLENVKFSAQDGLRVPLGTHFVQPSSPDAKKADLQVEWKKRIINPELGPEKFDLVLPPGVGQCGGGPPPVTP